MKNILFGIMISTLVSQSIVASEAKDYQFNNSQIQPRYVTFSNNNVKPTFSNNTVEWYYNNRNQHLSHFNESETINAFKSAMRSWSNISGVNFVYKGITSNNINVTNDKIITVGFWSEGSFINKYGKFSGYTSMFWSGNNIYEGYIILNAGDNSDRSVPTSLNDLEGLITHEVGHLLGIDHSNVEESVMYSNPYHSYGYQRILRQDDINIATLLYPVSTSLLTSDVVFNDIENNYSEWFPPRQTSQRQGEYYYRFYPNDSYLVEWSGGLWYKVQGLDWIRWGAIRDWEL